MKRMPLRGNDANQVAETFRQTGPLAGLDAATLALLASRGEMIELAAGEALIREGDAVIPEVYLLVQGALLVRAGGTQVARLTRPGDVVGEAAVMHDQRRQADVLADGAVRLLCVQLQMLNLPEFKDVAAGVRSGMLRDDWVQY